MMGSMQFVYHDKTDNGLLLPATHTCRSTSCQLESDEAFERVCSTDIQQLKMPHKAQLYNEEVNDLLNVENTKLAIHESRDAGVYVAGLREASFHSSTRTLCS